MASYFGEIIEPESRCFVSDGSEYFVENKYVIRTSSNQPISGKGQFDYLVIAFGKVLAEFALTYMVSEHTKVVEQFDIICKPDDSDKSSSDLVTSTLYQVTENTLLFVCERLPHLYLANSLLQRIKPVLESTSHTIVLTSEHMINFKPKISFEPFIRSLHTKEWELSVQAPNLELPNTISGFAAAVISWCQANKKSALAYIIYIDSSHLDSIVAQPLLQLLKTSKFMNSLVSASPKPLQNILNKADLQCSNMYL